MRRWLHRSARRAHTSFTVVHCPKLGPIDHDWMFRNPTLLVSALKKLRLEALEPHPAQERVPK
jgi:hypothetical protein